MGINIQYKEKYVAFLDVLGFGSLVASDTLEKLNSYFTLVTDELAGIDKDIDALMISDSLILITEFNVENLKKLDGTSQEIKDYLFELPDVQEYWDKLKDFFLYSIEKSYKEGRFFMHFSIGCTGGRHRSVAFIEELAKTKLDYVEFFVKHRDVYREG